MALEISASRLLAPYFGTSLFVWTNIIGIVLLALSIGYYAGGKISESRPQSKVLFSILTVSGALISVIPMASRPLSGIILETVLSAPSGIFAFVGSFFAVIFLFALPVGLLGMVSPFLIKLLAKGRSDVGASSGILFAVGTLGSMVGTFLPTLVFIPIFGTRLTITLCGAFILALGLYGLLKGRLRLFAILPFALCALRGGVAAQDGLMVETESSYQLIRVFSRVDNGRELRFNEGLGIQSLWTPTGYVGHGYWDFPAALFLLPKEFPKRAAVLGLAAGTIPRSTLLRYPDKGVEIDGVEIDSKVIEVAKKYFDMERPGLRIINADARIFIEQPGAAYDLIFVDAYSNQMYIPFHLASKEFFTSVKNRMTGQGIVAMNVNAVSERSPLLLAITNTLASVFPHVTIVPVSGTYNFLVLAGNKEPDYEAFIKNLPPEFNHVGNAIANRILWQKQEKGRILTDDKAPVELLTDALAFELLAGHLAED